MEIVFKADYIYKRCKLKMSDRKMADFLYACFMTQTNISDSFGIGIYDQTKHNNKYHYLEVILHIHPSRIAIFESMADVKLLDVLIAHTN